MNNSFIPIIDLQMSEGKTIPPNTGVILDILARNSTEKLSTSDLILQEFEGKSPEYIVSNLKAIQDSGLFKRHHFSKFFYGLIQKIRNQLENKSELEKLHASSAYWEISSMESQAFLFSRGKGSPTVSAFAPGGSYGAFYLGYLTNKESRGEYPDVIIGSSAGALYPTLFSLWKMARAENPKLTLEVYPSEITLIPENLTNESMFWDGKLLISSFAETANKLIEIINQAREINTKLPNIEGLRFSDLRDPIGAVASRKLPNGEFQEVLFSGDNNVLQAITASSNPHVTIGPFSVSILKKTIFKGNEWYDGWHTNPIPDEYANPYKVSKVEGISLYPSGDFAKYSTDADVRNISPGYDLQGRTKIGDIHSQGTGFNRKQGSYWIEVGKNIPHNFENILTSTKKIIHSSESDDDKKKGIELITSFFLQTYYLGGDYPNKNTQFSQLSEGEIRYLYNNLELYLTKESMTKFRNVIDTEIHHSSLILSKEWYSKRISHYFELYAKEDFIKLPSGEEDIQEESHDVDVITNKIIRFEYGKRLLRTLHLSGQVIEGKTLSEFGVLNSPKNQAFLEYLQKLSLEVPHEALITNNTAHSYIINADANHSIIEDILTKKEITYFLYITFLDLQEYIHNNGFNKYSEKLKGFIENNFDSWIYLYEPSSEILKDSHSIDNPSKSNLPSMEFLKIHSLFTLLGLTYLSKLSPLEELEFSLLAKDFFLSKRGKKFLEMYQNDRKNGSPLDYKEFDEYLIFVQKKGLLPEGFSLE